MAALEAQSYQLMETEVKYLKDGVHNANKLVDELAKGHKMEKILRVEKK